MLIQRETLKFYIMRVQRAFALSMSEAEVRSALGSVKLSVSCIPKNLWFLNYFLENPMNVELPWAGAIWRLRCGFCSQLNCPGRSVTPDDITNISNSQAKISLNVVVLSVFFQCYLMRALNGVEVSVLKDGGKVNLLQILCNCYKVRRRL